MARPQRPRRVCSEPKNNRFIPADFDKQDIKETVQLTIDEYEVTKHIDYEKQTQVQCADMMNISRTTVAEIYNKARYKIMDSIVNGKELYISGGNYCVCEGIEKCISEKCSLCKCKK